MGKLNIAHHKSYHPYRRDNIEKVRKDEEEARLKEEVEDGRMRLADSEARMSLLRERAGLDSVVSTKSKKKMEAERERALLELAVNPSSVSRIASASAGPASLSSGGHINLFEDVEQASLAARSRELDKLAKAKGKADDEKGVPLAPDKKDLNPWYIEKKFDPERGKDDEKKYRDASHKSMSDPLTSIKRELATRFPSTTSTASSARSSYHSQSQMRQRGLPASASPTSISTLRSSSNAEAVDPHHHAAAERFARESVERARVRELKERKKRGLAGSATPSTLRDESAYRYGDQFNARAVEDAHRDRDRDRRWDGRRARM